jgi:hypothetical protein
MFQTATLSLTCKSSLPVSLLMPMTRRGASPAAAARQLGRHYLQRYFFLLAFRAYLDAGTSALVPFARWFAERAELKHLMNTLALDVAV